MRGGGAAVNGCGPAGTVDGGASLNLPTPTGAVAPPRARSPRAAGQPGWDETLGRRPDLSPATVQPQVLRVPEPSREPTAPSATGRGEASAPRSAAAKRSNSTGDAGRQTMPPFEAPLLPPRAQPRQRVNPRATAAHLLSQSLRWQATRLVCCREGGSRSTAHNAPSIYFEWRECFMCCTTSSH